MAVYLFATLDTKGPEANYVRNLLVEAGVSVVLVDTGCLGQVEFSADISREQFFATGGFSWSELATKQDRGSAVSAAAQSAAKLASEAYSAGKLSGVLGLGGSAGTTIGTAAMRSLPLGVPKVMASTLASQNVRAWVQNKDIFMLNTVVDISGLNRISRPVLAQAAAAMAGLIQNLPAMNQQAPSTEDRPLIAASMFGVTTPCVQRAARELEKAGYEVVVFHATGNGGESMEALIREGVFAGVLDVTTTELADELVGGILSAGPTRLTAAGEMGIPQVVSVGALDMVNFGPRESVPVHFADRQFHVHNAHVTLMRTTPEENAQLGRQIAEKLNQARGPVALLLPQNGVSAIDETGKPFSDPVAREALFSAIEQNLVSCKAERVDAAINDEAFAVALAQRLLELLPKRS